MCDLSVGLGMEEGFLIPKEYDGMVFLYAAQHNPPILHPHRHEELECNIVMEGEITYVLGMARYTLKQGDMIWLFPHQKHQLIDRSSDAQIIVCLLYTSPSPRDA